MEKTGESKLYVMIEETMLGKFLVLCARASIVGKWIDADSATWSEKSYYLDVFRIHKFDKILHNDIYAILMKISVVSETEKIELETLALHHFHIRDILYLYFCKVWLACDRTEGGKLWAIKLDPIIIIRMLVYEAFKHLWSIVLTIISLFSECL